MRDAVAATLASAGVASGDRLCCSLSGGIDSVVLLDVLHTLQPQFGFELLAAHVHHGLSPHADAWLKFCSDLCHRRELPFVPLWVEVARDDPEGLEAAARRARHAALSRIACTWLALGHHQDDQAETLLFRLFRGTGSSGAGAMRAVESGAGGRPGRLRPLLSLRRAQIEDWARTRGLDWVEDESNLDCRFSRNAIRHRILPAAAQTFPGAVPALARAADHFREAGELLEELAAIDEAACGGALLQRERVLALSDARVANLLRWQARRLGARAPARVRLREALRQLRQAAPLHPLRLSLGEVACCVYRGQVWLEALCAPPQGLRWCGEARLPWADGEIVFQAVRGRGLARAALEQAESCWLQPRFPGLRMQTDARRPRRSFKNLCQEAAIPPWLRERLPVLVVQDRVAWIGGLGCAADHACPAQQEGIEPVWFPRSR
jgi:tRNA(Ile)-lysidine synthase